MPVLHFPDPNKASPEGVVAIGGDLHTSTLLAAYRKGIFPWPIIDFPVITWFSPPQRAILNFSELHIPSRLQRIRKQNPFTFTIDYDFEQTIINCALSQRPSQPGTWITKEMQNAYLEFHKAGYAHSIEAWDNQTLVGGLYGVEVDGTFAGESMFYFKPNASKLAFLYLVDYLQSKGLQWMDIQVMTPHMKNFGAKEIPRQEFLSLLSKSKKPELKLF